MASEHREVVTPGTTEVVTTPAPAAAVDRTAATAYDPYAGRRHASYRLVQAVYLVFGLIEALLVIRFVLRALGANASAGFAQFIYGLTAPLVAPFVGLFGNPQAGGSVLELHSIVALVVWRGTVDRGGPVPSSPFTPWKCLRMTLSGDAASPTSIMINKYPPAEVARVLLLVVGFGLGAYVLWRIQEVLVLLFIAILLATAIEPIVNRLRRGPFTRGSGVLVVYTAIMLVIGVAGYLVVPNVLGQAGSFAQSLPERLQALRTQVAGLGQPSVRGVLLGLLDQASRAVQSPAQPGQEELVAVGTAAAQTIISVVTVFVLAFYWLVERATIKPVLLRSVPPARARTVNTVWLEVEEKLGGWVRGQLILKCSRVRRLATVMPGLRPTGPTTVRRPEPYRRLQVDARQLWIRRLVMRFRGSCRWLVELDFQRLPDAGRGLGRGLQRGSNPGKWLLSVNRARVIQFDLGEARLAWERVSATCRWRGSATCATWAGTRPWTGGPRAGGRCFGRGVSTG